MVALIYLGVIAAVLGFSGGFVVAILLHRQLSKVASLITGVVGLLVIMGAAALFGEFQQSTRVTDFHLWGSIAIMVVTWIIGWYFGKRRLMA